MYRLQHFHPVLTSQAFFSNLRNTGLKLLMGTLSISRSEAVWSTRLHVSPPWKFFFCTEAIPFCSVLSFFHTNALSEHHHLEYTHMWVCIKCLFFFSFTFKLVASSPILQCSHVKLCKELANSKELKEKLLFGQPAAENVTRAFESSL